MEIKLGDRTFQVNQCPAEGPRKATLKRNLRDHGPEAFLTSAKLKPFAGCVMEELQKAEAEEVGPAEESN